MTGIRSCIGEVTELASVVRIAHVLIHSSSGSFQRSHNPANAKSLPSLTSKQKGWRAVPFFCYS
jgi:hypothetical protein